MKFDDKQVHGTRHALGILDVFSSPHTLEEALAILESRIKGNQSWIEITREITRFASTGVLVDPSDVTPKLESHRGRFDAAAVHIRMLYDRKRTDAYQKAIRDTVQPDDIVIDIGTGTGILAATAAMAGAKLVYAIENTGLAKIAQRVFDTNGLSEKVTVIEGRSTQIDLPEKADLLVSEIIGNDPLQEGVLQTTADAVKRLLKPHARLLPDILNVHILPLSIPEKFRQRHIFVPTSSDDWQEWYEIDFTPLSDAARNCNHFTLINTYIARDWPAISDPILVKKFDLKSAQYEEIDEVYAARSNISGELNGLLIYFDLTLGPSVNLSIHPMEATPANNWGSKLWMACEPVTLEMGEEFKIAYRYGRNGSRFQVTKS